jgi:hypothetical protein
MFATQVPEYQEDRRLGLEGAAREFDRNHPLFRTLAGLSHLRVEHEALRRGRQITRDVSSAPGIFAVSRIDPSTGREIVIAFNTGTEAVTATFEVDPGTKHVRALHGECAPEPMPAARYTVTLAPLDFVICAAGE